MPYMLEELKDALHAGFIEGNSTQASRYKPELLVNNAKKNVLSTFLAELENCETFIFSVAFITESGLATLKSQLLDLQKKQIKGRILTSTYLFFNTPKIFRELMKLKNVEIRLTNIEGFHSKGYIFEQKDHYSLIVGSSNLTAHALKVNHEWNIKLTSLESGEVVHHFNNQFEEVWQEAELLSETWIEKYEEEYEKRDIAGVEKITEAALSYNTVSDALSIQPNKMQEAALGQIEAVRASQKDKALIISATGTGKTYLSAFDVRAYQPKRFLFVVHREQILEQAMSDYKRLLGGKTSDFGMLSGSSKDIHAKYIFATIQTLAKEETLHTFEKDTFDYILIDEVHKAGAPSYQRIIDYFDPNFLLGMTATPERSDDFNIFELFDYNIAYEIRLQEALEEKMLSPFHYFGVTDLELDGEVIEDTTLLTKLVTEDRVDHIIEKIGYYGYSGERIKGLMFCSRKEEAKTLSKAFNGRGYRTVALTGEDTSELRTTRIKELEVGKLDYIITVDIFNEGIDIPSINQVVMLRQTESSIIFIQQLGRGLRLHESKDYLTVIDFIGNYKNNYLIPVALAGDQSQNKDNMRRHTQDTSFIKGVSTINFEEIAKKRIFDAINTSKLTHQKVLKEAYENLKNRIGRIPKLSDFIENHSIDPMVIVDKFNSYYEFLLKMKEELPILNEYELQVLRMLSLEVMNGKREHEINLLEAVLEQMTVKKEDYQLRLARQNCRLDEETLASVQRIFNLSFFTKNDVRKYGGQPIIEVDEIGYSFNEKIQKSLKRSPYFKEQVLDIVKTARLKSEGYSCKDELTLYEKYSRKEVCKLLNWESDESSTLYGYKPKFNTCPIFITYDKHEDVKASLDYQDEFLSPNVLKWESKNNRTLKSNEIQNIVQSQERNYDIHIFVKKDDAEGTDFYYLGKAFPDRNTARQDIKLNDHNKELPIVHMNMLMEQEVENGLYRYLVE